ncbi:MAG: type II secretion system protein [Candidatus Parcubacteria bacterium]|nr:type II secretion system protein [Candidatus Parcubacteria bacterium]
MLKRARDGGFTIVELLVSVALFAAVIIAVSGSFLVIVDSYKKITAQRENIDNLSTAMESMVRGLKTGMNFHCEVSPSAPANITDPRDCPSGGKYIAFKRVKDSHIIQYKFVPCTGVAPEPLYCGQLQRSDDYSTFYPVTDDPSIMQVSLFNFYVVGTTPLTDTGNDITQPKVNIVMKGTVGGQLKRSSAFNIQTTITQRRPDIQ